MTQAYADLEIGLHRRDAKWYQVEFRFSRPDSDTDDRLAQAGKTLCVQFNLDNLRSLLLDAEAYGKLLSGCLFGSEVIRTAFEKARTAAQSLDAPLRIRLFIGPSAPELQSLRWETLRDPQEDRCLLTDEHILFSRYLSSFDWRPVRLRPQADLRALVVVANPSDLADYGMSVLDVDGEIERAKAGLGDMAITVVESGGTSTLANIITQLRKGCDILYLVAHGMFVDNEPWLWLEQESGDTQRVSGSELITRLQEIDQRPRLVILSSCQSAGTGKDTDSGKEGILAALGPRLAQAGIPAVIAMQGFIAIKTMEEFLPVFFQELQKDGQIDRAIAVARGAVREQSDWWMPALFMRLKSGRIWYVPGFGGDKQEFEQWKSVKNFILDKTCTPILGSGLVEPWFGQASELARHWAEEYRYPFALYEQEELPRIAQYIARRDGARAVQSAFNNAIREELLKRCSDALPEDLRILERWSPDKILCALELAAEQCWTCNAAEAHRQLAELRLPIYITTSPGNILAQALTKAGARPQVRLCPWWSQRIPERQWRYDDEPSAEQPLVYHLFGHLDTPASIVLSEDNYFDFLIGIMRNKDLIPDTVVNALTSTALLFLGFRSDDWGYRVLFRWLMAQEGKEQLREFTHVTAQIEPDEGRVLDTRRARQYLEKVFNKDNINMYWGRSEDFLTALARQLRKT
ncbi:MAG: CHAT domain-containing protein [bacterium]|nr:CHAT domain-containing protein [bacterium]